MNNIEPFRKYKKIPNDICYGSIYTLKVKLPLLYYKDRIIRVFLPEDYDPKNKYPLLVMSDGQNIVDKYTSAYGAWEIDKRQHELIIEGYPSFIVVGIDCPKGPLERAIEYSFPFIPLMNKEEGKNPKKNSLEFESHLLYKYIGEELIPLIKENFSISDKKEEIASGGSSMGGVYALSLHTSYPDIFGISLNFSPAYFLYKKNLVNEYMEKALKNMDKSHRFFFYSGNVNFEHRFLKRTIDMNNYLKDKGYDTKLVIDMNGEHNEPTWSYHFNEAIKYWLKKGK